ncbi:dihydrofolate reductase family protein [Kribbella solani]|uniref:Dihydrofolate reductase n=1 Tax=Kribbella solani TaxID=236067 RepID=A0A841DJE0_9ACTN|nr:dihydrofolate reductase family protein [Kribbella solani]MBB5977195.1 dihydrofolate reductase [Kribbella solani]MDX2973735.1 dihydrofolate reductase family protein [Kribbella solani]MDX3002110.1 dihydrofolate reductase family protein [Kribbella solani]
MRKLIESTFMTLNGAIDAPQNWSPPYWDDEHMAYNAALMEGVEAQVLGRVTYEGFADAWLSRAGDPFADQFNAMPKYVATRTLTEFKWNAQPLEGDAAEAVRKLKASDGGDLIKYGTGEFSKTLLEHKLVDEYHFWIFPVLADGETMLQGSGIEPTHLELLGTTTFKSGIVVHKLAPKA